MHNTQQRSEWLQNFSLVRKIVSKVKLACVEYVCGHMCVHGFKGESS